MQQAVDLSTDCAGIRSPNPFWLASGPPTNTAYQCCRAFEAGWGGVVWKTITHDPIVNVSSRYGSLDIDGRRMVGFNNIELISDRPLADNLAEIAETKRLFPERAMVVSLMVESTRQAWHDIVKRTEDTGCDGLELNFGCPHGMNERGMGSAVGQVPEYTEMITAWVKEAASVPVLVKLTPNITDVRSIGRAAAQGGADGIALINTINSIIGLDLDTLNPIPHVDGRGAHGGYCGPAVKPIALNMVHSIASDPQIALPISGIGGIQKWQDAVEYLLLGASSVQLCTAVMQHGFRIVNELTSGLEYWMRGKGFRRLDDFIGASVNRIGQWSDLNLGYQVVAKIDQQKCINCGLCYIACEDGAHQAISMESIPVKQYLDGADAANKRLERSGRIEFMPGLGEGRVNVFKIIEESCVGCNLCTFVCPVSGCIRMVEKPTDSPQLTWREYQKQLASGNGRTKDR